MPIDLGDILTPILLIPAHPNHLLLERKVSEARSFRPTQLVDDVGPPAFLHPRVERRRQFVEHRRHVERGGQRQKQRYRLVFAFLEVLAEDVPRFVLCEHPDLSVWGSFDDPDSDSHRLGIGPALLGHDSEAA